MHRVVAHLAALAVVLVVLAACSRTPPDVVGSPFEVVDHQVLGLNSNGGDVDYFLVALPGVHSVEAVEERYEQWLREHPGRGAVNYEPASEFVRDSGFTEERIARGFADAADGDLGSLIVVVAE